MRGRSCWDRFCLLLNLINLVKDLCKSFGLPGFSAIYCSVVVNCNYNSIRDLSDTFTILSHFEHV